MFNGEMVNLFQGFQEMLDFRVISQDRIEKSKRFYICAPFTSKHYPEEW